MLRLIVLSLAVPALAVLAASAEHGCRGPLDAIHLSYDAGELGHLHAARRYLLAARRHRNAPLAASEAFFHAGAAFEKLGRFRGAAEAYLAVVANYPETEWFMPSLDALQQTGVRVFEEARARGAPLDIRTAKRVFDALAGAGLSPEDTAAAVYRRGVCSLLSRQSVEAEFDFRRVLEEYDSEPWREKAYFKLGKVYAGRVGRPTRDQTATMRAISHFASFLEAYPDSELSGEARRAKSALEEKKAEYLFHVCKFYRRSGRPESLELYLGILTRDYPGTSWAELAAEEFAE